MHKANAQTQVKLDDFVCLTDYVDDAILDILYFSEDIYADTLNTRMSALKSLRLSTNTNLTEKCELKSDELEDAIENFMRELESQRFFLSQTERERLERAESICKEIKELRTKMKDAESRLQVAESALEKSKKQQYELLKQRKEYESVEFKEKLRKVHDEIGKLNIDCDYEKHTFSLRIKINDFWLLAENGRLIFK